MTTSYVGIDPAAATFTSATWVQGRRQVNHETFSNDSDGYDSFVVWLEKHRHNDNPICVENTGVYSEALCYALYERGYPIVLLDPNKVWKGAPARRAKTDPIDAHAIARYGGRHLDELELWKPNLPIAEEIRTLLATREHLVKQRTATLNVRTAQGRKVVKSAVALKTVTAAAEAYKRLIKEIEAEIRRLIDSNPTLASNAALVSSVPGFKLLFSAWMIVLTDGFERAPIYRKLAHHIGIAPNPYESGTSVRREPRSRGYGPRTVRKLLHLAARSAATHNPKYRHYYQRKVAAGKPKRLVLNNIANKLLKTACAVLYKGDSLHRRVSLR